MRPETFASVAAPQTQTVCTFVVSPQTAKSSLNGNRKKNTKHFKGVLNGGIIGTLLDCHCNWTAAYHLMKRAGENRPPCTVTAEYAIKMLRPTPTNDSVLLSAKVVKITDDRATIEGTLSAGGKVCATCRGVFVAVKEGHPAYHRW
jgi:acyl-coenzyme A thioesterase PaaI-like protein